MVSRIVQSHMENTSIQRWVNVCDVDPTLDGRIYWWAIPHHTIFIGRCYAVLCANHGWWRTCVWMLVHRLRRWPNIQPTLGGDVRGPSRLQSIFNHQILCGTQSSAFRGYSLDWTRYFREIDGQSLQFQWCQIPTWAICHYDSFSIYPRNFLASAIRQIHFNYFFLLMLLVIYILSSLSI